MEKCIECDAQDSVNPSDCGVAWGACNHVECYKFS